MRVWPSGKAQDLAATLAKVHSLRTEFEDIAPVWQRSQENSGPEWAKSSLHRKIEARFSRPFGRERRKNVREGCQATDEIA
jgi:hypothetical protein